MARQEPPRGRAKAAHFAACGHPGTDCYVTFAPTPDASCGELLRASPQVDRERVVRRADGTKTRIDPLQGGGLFDAQSRRE